MGCLECGKFYDTKGGQQWMCDDCTAKAIKVYEDWERKQQGEK
ncbi:hypothetical protein [Ectobacillus ponti]|nr:hypothetical protein [Ectobacillus ponti]